MPRRSRGSAGELFVGRGDLVFPGAAGDHLDGSALRRRFKDASARAQLRPLRFHDLRHTFGSLAINRASIVQVQAWMGHADIGTTQRYLHHRSRADDARMLAGAFEVAPAAPGRGPRSEASSGRARARRAASRPPPRGR